MSTPLSYSEYIASGSDVFSVPFGYMNKTDVLVTVDGVPATFSFLSTSSIKLSSVPVIGATVRVFRRSDLSAPAVSYSGGSSLTSEQLNKSVAQLLFAAQESAETPIREDIEQIEQARDVALGARDQALSYSNEAGVYADVAGASRDEASAFAEQASEERDGAETARSLAETASSNAQSSARTTATWTALSALTPTVLGQGAEVLDSDAGTHVDPQTAATVNNAGRYTAYALTAGAWTRIGDTGLSGKLSGTQFLLSNSGGFVFTIADSPQGNIGAGLKDDGTWLVYKLKATSLIEGPYSPAGSNVSFGALGYRQTQVLNAIADAAGNQGEALWSDGFRRNYGVDVNVLKAKTQLGILQPAYSADLGPFEIHQINSYGQSLSIGVGSTAATTVQADNDLMFNGGIKTAQDSSASDLFTPSEQAAMHTSFVPAVEATLESGVVAFMHGVHELLRTENLITPANAAFRMLGSAAGVGGQSISVLSKGNASGIYDYLISDATYGKQLANASNASICQQAVLWSHGESSSTNYAALLNQLIADANTDIKAAMGGQVEPVHFIAGQVSTEVSGGVRSRPENALAMEQLNNPLFHLACPQYLMIYGDQFHMRENGYILRDFYYALVYKRVVIDKVEWKPTRPNRVYRVGNALYLVYDVMMAPLVFDSSIVAAAANQGFELAAPDGVTPIAISSVSLAAPNVVKIVAGASLSAGGFVRYAYTPQSTSTSTPRINGARGNLRDSYGDFVRISSANGRSFAMHNYGLTFERSFT